MPNKTAVLVSLLPSKKQVLLLHLSALILLRHNRTLVLTAMKHSSLQDGQQEHGWLGIPDVRHRDSMAIETRYMVSAHHDIYNPVLHTSQDSLFNLSIRHFMHQSRCRLPPTRTSLEATSPPIQPNFGLVVQMDEGLLTSFYPV